jgi:rhodanese-related sulfurtransferase
MLSEKAGVQAASALVDRGIENIYLLTGGFEQFLNDFPSLC